MAREEDDPINHRAEICFARYPEVVSAQVVDTKHPLSMGFPMEPRSTMIADGAANSTATHLAFRMWITDTRLEIYELGPRGNATYLNTARGGRH